MVIVIVVIVMSWMKGNEGRGNSSSVLSWCLEFTPFKLSALLFPVPPRPSPLNKRYFELASLQNIYHVTMNDDNIDTVTIPGAGFQADIDRTHDTGRTAPKTLSKLYMASLYISPSVRRALLDSAINGLRSDDIFQLDSRVVS